MAKMTNADRLAEAVNKGGEGFSWFFETFVSLAREPVYLRAALAFGFHLSEMGQNRVLYGGLCREHRLDPDLARVAVDKQHLTRDKFEELYKAVFSKDVPTEISMFIENASEVRNKMIHGKQVNDSDVWKALFSLVNYAVGLNKTVQNLSGFEPFGKMTGSTGFRDGSLDKSTTRWVLKGMSFSLS